MTRLYLIRHGQTTSNLVHALDTRLPGASLTDLGREQATAAGSALAQVTRRVAVVSSLAARAHQTAAVLATVARDAGTLTVPVGPGSDFAEEYSRAFRGPVPTLRLPDDATAQAAAGEPGTVATVPGITEIPAGDMEMRNDAEAHTVYHGLLGSWLHGDLDAAPPGGATGREVLDAYLTSLSGLVHAAVATGTDLAVVSHGAVIRLVARWLGDVDPAFAWRTYLPNAHRIDLDLDLDPASGQPGQPGQPAAAGPAAPDALRGAFRVVAWGAGDPAGA
ncbi:histidine phosphatase family protein [Corynebacterium bovis]|uniref:histidine phosphatase family protein n=1 Tax=Corynebacterium bovis TaxID=36808 RepID=UPI00163B2818|nr:histidine phosphatase family protein [Corynebacterium bovis]MDN8580211.1 histidine phosphatase family protein [Corynebacterium bovis]